MSNSEQDNSPEIVIVRRKSTLDEEGHHGGVWKVAYADFMTAMMAFFLVMWLINAANEETRVQVASYFNPVKLVDPYTNPRGIQESSPGSSGDVKDRELPSEAKAKVEGSAGSNSQKKDKDKKDKQAAKSGENTIGERELFRDPLQSLDKIAGGAPDVSAGESRMNFGATGGEEFRDPFSPKSWEVIADDLPEDSAGPAQEKTKVSSTASSGEAGKKKAGGSEDKTSQARKTRQGENLAAARAASQPKKVTAKKENAEDARVKELKAALEAEMARGDRDRMPGISVRKTAEGVLISLTDKAGFGMFDVASAKPKKELVLFMEKISRLLAKRPGKIVVRGHTDGRPFSSGEYDNWRLSTARAHVARYMLIRGGISEKRFVRVEGYADKKLAFPKDPFDARNRRIEILLLD